MQRCAFVFLVSVMASTVRASFDPLNFAEVVGSADLIVAGTIVDLTESDFRIDVSDVLHGDGGLKQLRVKRFGDWTCAKRWTPYANGQRLLFFLWSDSDDGGVWRILGAGDEGEMPIDGEFIYPSVLLNEPPIERPTFEVYGGKRGQRVSSSDFVNAVRGIREHFHIARRDSRRGFSIRQVRTNRDVSAYRKRSAIHALLVDELLIQKARDEDAWRAYLANYAREPGYENWIIWAAAAVQDFAADDPRRIGTLRTYVQFLRKKGRDAHADEIEKQIDAIPRRRPKIVDIHVRSGTLVVEREGCRFDAVDLATGRLLGSRTIELSPAGSAFGAVSAEVSEDGRLIAHASGAKLIRLAHLYGTPPAVSEFPVPERLAHEPGGWYPARLVGERVYARTNFQIAELDLRTGRLIRTDETWSAFPSLSRNGRYIVTRSFQSSSNRSGEESDRCAIGVSARGSGEFERAIRIEGHGCRPDLLAGRRGLYIRGGAATSLRIEPYDGGKSESLETGSVSICDESLDGGFIAVSSPSIERLSMWPFVANRSPAVETMKVPTVIQVWDTATRWRRYEIDRGEHLQAAFSSNPDYLVCTRLESEFGEDWLAESVLLFDASTGKFVRELQLPLE
ncbi:MAG: hypothetical protein IT450_01045 [Phycisphaerales bacterium]|nr:hypothetical protein [Phycisphaerales bacterium]